MTVLGFHVTNARQAVAWADTELYCDGEPRGETAKLAVNALLGVMAAGTGNLTMIRAGANVVHTAASLGEILERLPGALRSDCPVPPLTGAAFFIIAHSGRLGSLVGWVCAAERDFIPMFTRAWCSPQIDEQQLIVTDVYTALSVATAQLSTLRRTVPAARGGALTIAALNDGCVEISPAIDCVTGKYRYPRRAQADDRRSDLARGSTPHEFTRALAPSRPRDGEPSDACRRAGRLAACSIEDHETVAPCHR
jgi:hypothetical protein